MLRLRGCGQKQGYQECIESEYKKSVVEVITNCG